MMRPTWSSAVLAMKRRCACSASEPAGYVPVSVMPPHMWLALSIEPSVSSMPLQSGSAAISAMPASAVQMSPPR